MSTAINVTAAKRVRPVLIRRADLDAIKAGSRDLAFRRWKRPTVKAGGTLRTAVGVLSVEAVDAVKDGEITDAEARRAGFDDRAMLLEALSGRDGETYRVRLAWAGEDPRVQLRQVSELSDEDRAEIDGRLERYDAASRHGPWTRHTLELIQEQPATLAADLATTAGWERVWFKRNVRKLKELGLTESLKVGYRLSPRGQAYLDGPQE